MGRIWVAGMYRSVGELVAVQDQLWANDAFCGSVPELAAMLESAPEDITARIVQIQRRDERTSRSYVCHNMARRSQNLVANHGMGMQNGCRWSRSNWMDQCRR